MYLELYDVILLDGMFFEKKDQEIGTEDESGIGMAIRKINQLSSKKAFPWFVLSGKDKFTKSENMLLNPYYQSDINIFSFLSCT